MVSVLESSIKVQLEHVLMRSQEEIIPFRMFNTFQFPSQKYILKSPCACLYDYHVMESTVTVTGGTILGRRK